MSKKPKSSTRQEFISKECPWMEYLSEQSFRLFPEKEQWRKRLCATLLEWAQSESALDIKQFCMEYRIPYRTVKCYFNKYPDFKEVYDDVKFILGTRRHLGALTRKFDKDVVFKDLHRYDPDFNEVNRYHAELKKSEQNDKPTTVNVIMEDYTKDKK